MFLKLCILDEATTCTHNLLCGWLEHCFEEVFVLFQLDSDVCDSKGEVKRCLGREVAILS